ncbi:MAG: Secretion system C-terminal sorting domain [Bacteroidota bacterium]|jgi:hypothetical protein
MIRLSVLSRRYLMPVVAWMYAAACFAGVRMGLHAHTIGDNPHHLLLSYSSTTDYDSPDRNVWNSQVFTLRWSASLGNAVVGSISNLADFDFKTDGQPVQGGDGFLYQKFAATGAPVHFNLPAGQRIDVLLLHLVFDDAAAWSFELVSDTPWLSQLHGLPNAENAALSDQFLGFDPALAVYSATDAPSRITAGPSCSVAPNPSAGLVLLSLETYRPASWNLFVLTMAGQCRRADKFFLPAGPHRLSRDFSDLPPGPYLLRLQSSEQTITLPMLRAQ